MQVAVDVAGFSAGDADELRRAMGAKRSTEKMEKLRGRFVLVRTGAGHPKQADQPQSVYSDLAVRQAVQQDIARHGADQRLAQATRDGVDDSWHEEP